MSKSLDKYTTFKKNVLRWKHKYATGEVSFQDAANAIAVLTIAHYQQDSFEEMKKLGRSL